MRIRAAQPSDATAMSEMLQRLVAAGKRTSRADEGFVLQTYITDPHRIVCSLAEDETGQLLGFQSMKLATDGNPYGTPTGWGIIGTHVSPLAARRGVGSGLFEVTRKAAVEAGIPRIEAFIGATNIEGQNYYEKMGFRTYRTTESAVCKCYQVPEL
jgi:GNAT superfamily N-acetyltransferase